MKKSIFLAFGIVTQLLLNSCEPKDKYYYLNQESKDWALYKPGSWWVYRDSILNERDSLFITNYLEQFSVENSDKKNYNYQTINYFISNKQTSEYSFALFCSSSTAINFNGYVSFNSMTYKTVLTYFAPFPESSDWSTINTLPNYEVKGFIYSDVLHIRAGYSEKNDINNLKVFYHDYWLAKGKGFIKMVERTPTDTTVWLLEKYNIVQ